jgi:GT2 family glycosyltransferase
MSRMLPASLDLEASTSRDSDDRSGRPLFTVVVPTRDRPVQIRQCLEALRLQEMSDHEIVVVDDGSREEIDSIVSDFDPLPVRLVHQRGSGPAAARNRGAYEANGEFLAFTDDDCTPRPDWLGQLAVRCRNDPEQMVGGRTVNRFPDNLFSSTSQSINDYLYDHYNRHPESGRFLATNNLAISRAAFLDLGGLDESFPQAAGEDRDLCWRWVESGRKIVFSPTAVVVHGHELNLPTFLRQQFNYGCGARSVSRLLHERWGRGEGKPLSFYTGLVLHPLHERPLGRALALTLLTALSQIAIACGYVGEPLWAAPERATPARTT